MALVVFLLLLCFVVEFFLVELFFVVCPLVSFLALYLVVIWPLAVGVPLLVVEVVME